MNNCRGRCINYRRLVEISKRNFDNTNIIERRVFYEEIFYFIKGS